MLNILIALLIINVTPNDINPHRDIGTAQLYVESLIDNDTTAYNDCAVEGEWVLKEVETTAYTAGFESCGKLPSDPGYGITRSGLPVTENQTIATDWGVIPPGSFVIIEGMDPIYVAEDTGGAIKENKVDIYMENLGDAQQWGRQNRKVWVMEVE